MLERLSVQVNEQGKAVAVSFPGEAFSKPALWEIAQYQLKAKDKREIVIYRHDGEHIVLIHFDFMKHLRELFRGGNKPHVLVEELSSQMEVGKVILIRKPS